MTPTFRQRAIVSSFICTPPRSQTGLTFALFKRSRDVRTYPGQWAVCSGSVEDSDPSPESAAQREASEETGLSVPEDIQLLRRGKPFLLVDEQLRTEWTIHPFAWELKPHAKPIKIDWEHTEVRFVKPADLGEYDHVPQLEIGMSRVLVSKEIEEGLQALKDDHESGAQALAVKALEILLNSVQKGDLSKLSTTADFWTEVRWMAWHLGKNGRPSMATAIESQLFKTLNAVTTKLNALKKEGEGEATVDLAREITAGAIKAGIAAREHTLDRLAASFVKFIESRSLSKRGEPDKATPIRVATLSSSGTIMQCLSQLISTFTAKGLHVSLTVLESRPNFEGVSFVNDLLMTLKMDTSITDKLNIEIASDASVAMATGNADYLVFGGDKVLHHGDVCNKIGSLSAAIVAKTVNPQCHVIATFDTSKVTTSSFEDNHAKVEYNDEAEMVKAWPNEVYEKLQHCRKGDVKIEVQNAYFEWIAAKWIDTYISEEGVLSIMDIKRLSKQSKELEAILFSDI